jgi:hypothetical protein
MLLIIGELLRLYVLYAYWRQSGEVSASAAAGVLLGVAAGMGTSYVGWRVGLGG